MWTHTFVFIAIAVAGCKGARETGASREVSLQRAHAAAEKHDWSRARDELNAAAGVSPLSADEEKLRALWSFRQVLDLYCAGKSDDLTVSDLYQIPSTVPPGLDASTSAKAHELLARRELILQVRELRKKQGELSRTASEEPQLSKDCETAIQAVQSARTVQLRVLRRLESDYGPGIYEVQDSTGQTAHLTTTDTTFTTTGWMTITAYAFDDRNIIELSADRRVMAQKCLADQQQASAARSEFATSSKQLDDKIVALSRDFITSCSAATLPVAPRLTASLADATIDSQVVNVGQGSASSTPGEPRAPGAPTVTVDAIKSLIAAQVAALSAPGDAFSDSFDDAGSAWFPNTLDVAKGRANVAKGARASWGQPAHVEASPPVVGADEDVGWATTQWKVTTTSGTVLPVRVTEVFVARSTGLRVLAASFSIAPRRGSPAFKVDAPATGDGYPNDFDGEPAALLGSPAELAKNLRDDPATALVGSDASEVAIGPAAVQKLLLDWKKLSLSPLGAEVGVSEEANYAIYTGVLRTPGANPLAFQTLALFTRRGPEDRFLLAAVHFSAPQRR